MNEQPEQPEDWEQLVKRGKVAAVGALRRLATEQISRLERYQKPLPFRGTLLSEEEYKARLASQGGVCAICGEKPRSGRLAIDHLHGTTQVRGLLCNSCNKGLGFFKDDANRLASGIAYLSAAKVNRQSK